MWITVQIFGRQPTEHTPDCTLPDESLLQAINSEKSDLAEMQSKAEASLREIELNEAPETRLRAFLSEHNEKIREYNRLVTAMKAKRDAYRQLVDRYNEAVIKHRDCVKN